jgi:ubiquinol-cytochrome c reductase iron-sulfur subunit
MAKQTPLLGVYDSRLSRGEYGSKGSDLASTVSAHHAEEPTRRDFLFIATAAAGAVGAAAIAWPLIDQMNPDAAALALATTDIDISAIAPGASVTVKWRGKPVFVRNRTPEEIEAAKAVPLSDLPDQSARNDNAPDANADDANRAAPGKENWLIMVGICTHLGCVPLGQQGPYGGWFCPCHGSAYDTAGRIRQGPAPENLHVPKYEFISDTQVRVG